MSGINNRWSHTCVCVCARAVCCWEFGDLHLTVLFGVTTSKTALTMPHEFSSVAFYWTSLYDEMSARYNYCLLICRNNPVNPTVSADCMIGKMR